MSDFDSKQVAMEIGERLWRVAKIVNPVANWGVVKWVGEALTGEFSQKRTTGQIVLDAVVSMFPVLGEATAARDVIAILLRMFEDPKAREDRWEWVSLVLCLLAVVPILGGVLKGVGKLLMRAANDSEDLIKLHQEILAFARKLGYGNVQAWLNTLDFSEYSGAIVSKFGEVMDRFRASVEFIVDRMQATLPTDVKNYFRSLPAKIDQVNLLGSRAIPQALKDLNQLLDRVRTRLVDGTWADVTTGATASKVVTEEARLFTLAFEGGSKRHLPAKAEQYQHRTEWPDLEDIRFASQPPIPTFSKLHPIEAVINPPGEQIFRIIDTSKLSSPYTIPGRFWTTNLPVDGYAWRNGCAVKHAWSANGSYVMLKIPTAAEMREIGISVPDNWEGLRSWKGRIARQLDDGGIDANLRTMRIFTGGDIQYFVDFEHPHNIPVRSWIKAKISALPTNWGDTFIPGRAQVRAILLGYAARSSVGLDRFIDERQE